MNQVDGASLAALLPIPAGSVVFQYQISLDSTYFPPGSAGPYSESGVALVNLAQLPQQVYKVCTQVEGGQRYYCGVNVFKDGVDIKYQPFYWLGGTGSTASPPPNGLLNSVDGYRQAGPTYILAASNPQEADVNLASAGCEWLQTAVQPLFCTFSTTIISGYGTAKPASPQPKLVSTGVVSNPAKSDQEVDREVSYSEDQSVEFNFTATQAIDIGLKASLECGVSWFGLASGKFTMSTSLNLAFTFSEGTTNATTEAYVIAETVLVKLAPKQTKYVSVIIYADNNATATISFQKQVQGAINGQAMSGVLLQQIVEALGATANPPVTTTINSVAGTSVTYTISGQVTANVVFTDFVATFDHMPSQEEAAAYAAKKLAEKKSAASAHAGND